MMVILIPSKNYHAHQCWIQNMDAGGLGSDLIWQ